MALIFDLNSKIFQKIANEGRHREIFSAAWPYCHDRPVFWQRGHISSGPGTEEEEEKEEEEEDQARNKGDDPGQVGPVASVLSHPQ